MEDKIIEKVKTNTSAIISICFGIASIIFWEFSIIPILAINPPPKKNFKLLC